MKKVVIVFATAMFLISCGGSAESTVVADSTSVADSSVIATDSTVAELPADSTK